MNTDYIENKLFKYLKVSKLSPDDTKLFKHILFSLKPVDITYLNSKYNLHSKFKKYLTLWNNTINSQNNNFIVPFTFIQPEVKQPTAPTVPTASTTSPAQITPHTPPKKTISFKGIASLATAVTKFKKLIKPRLTPESITDYIKIPYAKAKQLHDEQYDNYNKLNTSEQIAMWKYIEVDTRYKNNETDKENGYNKDINIINKITQLLENKNNVKIIVSPYRKTNEDFTTFSCQFHFDPQLDTPPKRVHMKGNKILNKTLNPSKEQYTDSKCEDIDKTIYTFEYINTDEKIDPRTRIAPPTEDKYYQKYLLYKTKYLNLKNSF